VDNPRERWLSDYLLTMSSVDGVTLDEAAHIVGCSRSRARRQVALTKAGRAMCD